MKIILQGLAVFIAVTAAEMAFPVAKVILVLNKAILRMSFGYTAIQQIRGNAGISAL